uniref:Large ribosomal subunit protein bL32m n=1 Tax=Strongyloides stercoralis TaxID=6248 RepID=A0A0K0E982_STRER
MLVRLRKIYEEVIRQGYNTLSSIYPPLTPALALSPSMSFPCTSSSSSSSNTYDVDNIINDMRMLLGVPKYRTSKPKKQTRKFSFLKLLTPEKNIITCQFCGSYHEADTICKTCYDKVREVTNMIKEKMMKYNPYKGESQDRGIFVKYSDSEEVKPEVVNGKRIIEIEKPRNSWFIDIIKSDKIKK